MPKFTPANEFSICLALDATTEDKVLAIREKLPASPFRDDPPHLTLLRGLTSPTSMSDEELMRDLERLLHLEQHLPLNVKANRIMNARSPKYPPTSFVSVSIPPELAKLRKYIISTLDKAGYAVEKKERLIYIPHITLRLAVKANGAIKERAETAFQKDSDISLPNWFALRHVKDSNPRNFYPVFPLTG